MENMKWHCALGLGLLWSTTHLTFWPIGEKQGKGINSWHRAAAPTKSRPLTDGEGLETVARARRGVQEGHRERRWLTVEVCARQRLVGGWGRW
jgi:hypothetical protein